MAAYGLDEGYHCRMSKCSPETRTQMGYWQSLAWPRRILVVFVPPFRNRFGRTTLAICRTRFKRASSRFVKSFPKLGTLELLAMAPLLRCTSLAKACVCLARPLAALPAPLSPGRNDANSISSGALLTAGARYGSINLRRVSVGLLQAGLASGPEGLLPRHCSAVRMAEAATAQPRFTACLYSTLLANPFLSRLATHYPQVHTLTSKQCQVTCPRRGPLENGVQVVHVAPRLHADPVIGTKSLFASTGLLSC